MALFAVTKTGAALSTTADLVTIVAAAGKPLRVLYAELSGLGSSSAPNEVQIARSTGGTTPGGAITAEPLAGSGVASFAAYTSWSAQPTLDATA